MKTTRGAWFVGVVVVVSAGVSHLCAGTVTVIYSGTVSDIRARDRFSSDISGSFESFLPFAVGDAYSAIFEYDSGAVDNDPSSDGGSYDALTYEINIGGTVFGLATPWLEIHNDTAFGTDEVHLTGDLSSIILPDDWQVVYNIGDLAWSFGAYLTDSDGDVYHSDALPGTLNLADFDSLLSGIAVSAISSTPSEMAWFTPDGSFTARYAGIEMSIDRLEIVPEPTTMACAMVLVMLALAVRRREGQIVGYHKVNACRACKGATTTSEGR